MASFQELNDSFELHERPSMLEVHNFRAFLRNRGIVKMPLAAFQGNRFNILFYDGAGVYFLREHMTQYLTTAHVSALKREGAL